MLEDRGKANKLLFGEVLLEYGAVTREQLKKALEWQVRVGGRIGSILREMGFLDDDSLLSFLSKQFNTSPVNLFEANVPPNILSLLSFDKVRAIKAFPIKEYERNITLAMINPNDIHAIQEVEFALGRRVETTVAPYYQMEKAINYFLETGYGNSAFHGEQLKEKSVTLETKTPSIQSLLKMVVEQKATELHVTAGIPPSIRIDDEIRRLPLPNTSHEQMIEFASAILTKEQKEIFAREKEIDFVVFLPDTGRFRINIYRQRNSFALSTRHVKENIPSLEVLGLPECISDYALKSEGLVLITGPSGHGKTTTISALVDVINCNRRCNIVTIEDPIEYLHRHKKSNVNQREVGVDTGSFTKGLKNIFRQNPDVIVIGELRDPGSIDVALRAAETGHLVIGTLNSQNTATTIERIIDVFPAYQQRQVRMQLADSLLLAFAQRLVPRKEAKGRVLAYEMITNSLVLRNFILEGKAFNIRSLMQQVTSPDVISIDQSLARLCLNDDIEYEDGLKFSDSALYYKELVKSKNSGY